MSNSSNKEPEIQQLVKQSIELKRTIDALNHTSVLSSVQRAIDTINRSSPNAGLQRALDAVHNSYALSEVQRAVNALNKSHFAEQASRALRQANHFSEAISRLNFQQNPTLKRIESVRAELDRRVETYRPAIALASAWQAEQIARQTAMKSGLTLSKKFEQSLIGFARLSNLSDAVHSDRPYSTPVAELVASELGNGIEAERDDNENERDAAAVRAGLNPDLIAFQPSAYGEVVLAAGFKFRFTPMPAPQAVESPNIDVAFNPTHYQVFTELEQRLRHIVQDTLVKLAGSNWIRRRVSQSVRKRWEERQNEDRLASRTVYDAIQYADFMDLAEVVSQADNWKEAFQSIFHNRDDFIVSLRRLHPIRKAIAHSRPLGRADVLTLVSEATRIFSALGIQVLN